MAIINCKECGNEISDQADKCPNCGYPIKKIKNKNNNLIICIVCIIIISIVILSISGLNTTTVNNNTTYTIGKINYSVPKELTLTKKDEMHQFIINNSVLLQLAGFYNETNYKFEEKERELWYENSIESLIGDDKVTPSIENVTINNIVWKKIKYCKNDEEGDSIEHIVFMLLDNNSEYYYAVLLAQPNSISLEYITILENVMNSVTFISSDSNNEQTNSFTTVTKENYDRIKEGMTKAEVINILGEPESISESETPGLGTMELYHFQEVLSLKAIDIYFLNGSVYMKNWTDL